MIFYTILPLIIGAASAASSQHQFLRSPNSKAATETITQAVTAKATTMRNLLIQNTRHLQFNGTDDSTDDDFFGGGSGFNMTGGDFDFEFCVSPTEPLDLGDNMTVCYCSIKSGDLMLTNITTMLDNIDVIMANGIDAWIECSTVDPVCYENECGMVDVTCNMMLDFMSQDANSSSADVTTCVNYTNAPNEYPAAGIMENQSMCLSLDICLPDLATLIASADFTGTSMMDDTASSSMMGGDMEDILCGCNATLNGNECTCGICDTNNNGIMGIEIDCGDYKMPCTSFDMMNGTAMNVSQSMMPLSQFESTANTSGDTAPSNDPSSSSTSSTSSAALVMTAAMPFLMSGLSVLTLSFA